MAQRPNLDGFCGDRAYRQAKPIRLPFAVRRQRRGAHDPRGHRPVRLRQRTSTCRSSRTVRSRASACGSRWMARETCPARDRRPRLPRRQRRRPLPGGRRAHRGIRTSPIRPLPGYAVRIKEGDESFSAEMRIDEDLIGGWGGTVRMGFRHGSALWPPAHDIDSPATFGEVELGDTAPPLANMAPVAIVSGDFAVDLVDAMEIHLDGSASFDADGDSLGFSWTQTGGPTVNLVDADTSTPEFALLGDSPAGYLPLRAGGGRRLAPERAGRAAGDGEPGRPGPGWWHRTAAAPGLRDRGRSGQRAASGLPVRRRGSRPTGLGPPRSPTPST